MIRAISRRSCSSSSMIRIFAMSFARSVLSGKGKTFSACAAAV